MMAGWQVRPPRFVTIAGAVHYGFPVRVGHFRTRTSPGWTWSRSVIDRATRNPADTYFFWAHATPFSQNGARLFQVYLSRDCAVPGF
ncbi:MAG: hypothetical protein Ct9H300mP16_14110 [Pseudomonadota bacterium]|nr:MAG: hypothetical protein Ct9H300mP16_14110 [Pseudomonadota bacterium]